MKNKWVQKVMKSAVAVLVVVSVLAGCSGGKQDERDVTVRVGSLKGPTSMGLLALMEEAENATAEGSYEFTMATQADELLPFMVKGEMDIALVPANVAMPKSPELYR